MNDVLEEGIAQGLIAFSADEKNITYLHFNKKYRYSDPEESVRAVSYVQLILAYGYKPEFMALEVAVPHRVPNNWADIVVYKDSEKKNPFIVVECKKPDVTDAEFHQAIEQGFGYATVLRAKYLWLTSERLNEYYAVDGFPTLEREANKLADLPRANEKELPKAKYYKGGVNEFGGKAFDIAKVSEKELSRIFQQAHDALWSGGKRDPTQAFDELDKLIFCKIWDEKRARRPGTAYDCQVFAGESSEALLNRVKRIYEEGRKKDPEVFKDDIRLDAHELETVVGYLARVNMMDTDLDSKGRAFETFIGEFFRGKFGQFFTPRRIVEFIIDVLPITNDSFVLDPACGSGGFLLYALDKVRKQADEMAEQGYFKKESKEHREHWHEFAEHHLFGIEINEAIARTAKMNMIIHDDGHTNVISYDALENLDKVQRYAQQNKCKDYERYDTDVFTDIATNPPFGSVVKESEHSYMKDYTLGNRGVDWILTAMGRRPSTGVRDTQKSEILYLEQCFNFLKPGE